MQETASPTMIELPRPIARARLAVLISYGALVLYFGVLSVLSFETLNLAVPVVWLIQVLPLLIFARSLYHTHLRTYGWLCFVVLLYFMHGVLVAFDPSRRVLGIVEVTLCTIMFVALVIFIRGYKSHFKVNM